MTRLQKIVLAAALTLFAVWIATNFAMLTGDEDGTIRFVLGGLFALLILLRPGPAGAPVAATAPWRVAAVMLAGTSMAVMGLVFAVRQFEWLGLMLLLYACLRWSLPPRFAPDIRLALLLLYWLHPLPAKVFGQFQHLTQWLSVKGAEWALQTANAYVWADGLTLRSGFRAFAVPESCSGMRTAVTVLLTTLGVTTLFRLRWYETAAFLVIGGLQVLALNVVRIVGMVYWAPRMAPEWADTFLHDTLGLFLLVSILLTQLEVSWWKVAGERRRRLAAEIRQGRREPPDKGTLLPKFWAGFARWWLPTTAALLCVAGLAFAIYQRRVAHRVALLAAIVDDLMETDPHAAERAAAAALWLKPDDRSFLSKQAIVMVMRDKHRQALEEFDRLPGPLSAAESVMKSWALMSLGRAEEAIALVDALPASARNLPAVAIVRAEYAARENRPLEVSANVILAAGSRRVRGRARALFPYLARHEQWAAIAACGGNAPPVQELLHAVLAIHASLKTGNITQAAEMLKYAVEKWPNNPVYLGSLFTMAVRRPGGKWEDFFAENLRQNLATLDADMLAHYLNYCFQLDRPDLAWQTYLRLREEDPTDPALYAVPARFGTQWFRFRRQRVGLGAGSAEETVDLKPFLQRMQPVEPFRSFWHRIPLIQELAGPDLEQTRDRHLRLCLAELERREHDGRLSLRMEMTFPLVLAMLNRHAEVHARLDDIERKHPDLRAEVTLQHAILYNRQADWQNAYEAIRSHFEIVEQPGLTAHLVAVNAMMNLNLGLGAIRMAERVRVIFPGAPQIEMALAAIWDMFGFKEQALFVLSRSRSEMRSQAFAQLLYDTGRYHEAEKAGRVLGVTLFRKAQEPSDRLLPVPAEYVIAKRFPPPLTAAEMDRAARKIQSEGKRNVSPFVRDLARLEEQWYRAQGSAAASVPEQWSAVGRDALEKGLALHRLALLAGRQQAYDVALAATRQAVAFVPDAAVLRRMLIMLTDGDGPTIEDALGFVPNDPDVWLAALVRRTREDRRGPWVAQELQAAVAAERFSADTMVTAGDYLLRKGRADVASLAARDAIARGQGYLPAYVLGLKCAVATKDLKWALACALGGAGNAADPTPFYRAVVVIKAAGKNVDSDLTTALEYLREHDAGRAGWAERLGQIYFEQHDPARALAILSPPITEDARGVRVPSLLLAAESARLDGQMGKAVGLLETAYAMYPDKLTVLNNLVYNLAQDRRTLGRARALLPGLLAMAGDSFIVYDTAAAVHLRSGQLETARQYMDKALKLINENNYAALEVSLNSAEIMLRSGEYEQARRQLQEIRRNPHVTQFVDMNARQLLQELRELTGR